jgi:hypothetical protein
MIQTTLTHYHHDSNNSHLRSGNYALAFARSKQLHGGGTFLRLKAT